MNSINISGRLVYGPELKKTSNDKIYLPMRIAVSRNDANKTSDFFSCKAWNKTAEFIGKYFHKGDGIEITGELRTDSYEKQDGTKVTETYIFIEKVNFPLSKKAEAPRAEEPKTESLPFEI